MATFSFPNEEITDMQTMQYTCGSSTACSSVPEENLPWWASGFDPESLSMEEWDQICPPLSNATNTLPMDVEESGSDVTCTTKNSNHTFVWNGVDVYNILENINKADPGKAALKLMEVLFTDEEMSSCCFKLGSRRSSKPALDKKRVKLIEDCLLQYYGDKYLNMKDNVTKQCNQKCRDRARDKNKPRRSGAKPQQAQQINTALESKLDSLLNGQQQLLQTMNGLSFPAMQRYDVTGTESFADLPEDLCNIQPWDPDTLLN